MLALTLLSVALLGVQVLHLLSCTILESQH